MIDEATIGGGQQHVLWLAEGLVQRGFHVAVACEGRGYLVDELRRRQIPVLSIAITNALRWSSLKDCIEAIKKFRPDIVHTHGGTAGVYGRIAARFMKVPRVVHTYHGIHYLHYGKKISSSLFRWIDAVLLKFTNQLICVGENDRVAGIKAGVVDPQKSFVILNGIDLDRYLHIQNVPFSHLNITIGIIGRLHTQKGHAFLLSAFAQILKRHKSARLVIVGDGELRKALEVQAREEGIGANVDFLGDRTDIPEQLAAMDIFVLSSLWEGLPIVLMEAMAAGRSIVSTAVNGVTEILEHEKDALLVPPRNADGLAYAIDQLIGNRSRALEFAHAARKKAASRFALQTMVDRVIGVYQTPSQGR